VYNLPLMRFLPAWRPQNHRVQISFRLLSAAVIWLAPRVPYAGSAEEWCESSLFALVLHPQKWSSAVKESPLQNSALWPIVDACMHVCIWSPQKINLVGWSTTSSVRISFCAIAGLALFVAAQDAHAQNSPERLVVGDAKVKTIGSYKGPDLLPKPDKALLYGFLVPPNVVTMDESASARLHRRHQSLRGGNPESSPEEVQASFSKTLVSELRTARRYPRKRCRARKGPFLPT
jgi:hypothetical protein